MSAKSKISKQIVTRSQARKQHTKNTQTDSEICVCPSSDNFPPRAATMNEEQKAEFKTLLCCLRAWDRVTICLEILDVADIHHRYYYQSLVRM